MTEKDLGKDESLCVCNTNGALQTLPRLTIFFACHLPETWFSAQTTSQSSCHRNSELWPRKHNFASTRQKYALTSVHLRVGRISLSVTVYDECLEDGAATNWYEPCGRGECYVRGNLHVRSKHGCTIDRLHKPIRCSCQYTDTGEKKRTRDTTNSKGGDLTKTKMSGKKTTKYVWQTRRTL